MFHIQAGASSAKTSTILKAELTRLMAKPQAGIEPFTTRNENTSPRVSFICGQ